MKKTVLVLGLLAQVTTHAAFSMSNEKCWTTNPIMKSSAESKKIADETKLCAMEFYTDQLTVCPKLNSTNPGILVVKRSTAISDADFKQKYCMDIDDASEDKDATGEKLGKVVAKFKQTTSCSHASSPVTYYRVAEFLGGSRVPVAVFRTMDKQKHLEITLKATSHLAKSNQLIAQTWRTLLSRHRNAAANPEIFVGDTVYGALSENITGEYKFNLVGGVGSYDTRYQRFMTQRPFLAVSSGESVATLAGGTDFKKLAPVVTVMRDVSNMVVIDYMLNQADRIGNIHFKFKLYKNVNGKVVESKSKAKLVGEKEVIPADEQLRIKNGEVLVRETILKDNDCGISKENMMRKVGALEKVRHMNAKVYRQVQKLADYVRTAEGDRYFESELRIGHENFDSSTKSHNIRNNIITAAKILRENCESGRLNLDLDLEGLMADPNYKESCRVN